MRKRGCLSATNTNDATTPTGPGFHDRSHCMHAVKCSKSRCASVQRDTAASPDEALELDRILRQVFATNPGHHIWILKLIHTPTALAS